MKIIENISDEKIKRKKYSKHKKSYQRTKIDLSDIYNAQDTLNREERIADVLGNITSSSNFFTLDVGEKKIKKTKVKGKKRAAAPVLKCHKYINGLPGAKAISKKGDLVKQPACRVLRAALKSKGNTLMASAIRKSANIDRKRAFQNKRTPLVGVKCTKDLWNKKSSLLDPFDDVAKTYLKDPLKYYEIQTKLHLKVAPKHHRNKPTALEILPAPAAGASYNPSFNDHTKLIKKAAKAEIKRVMKKRKEHKRYESISTKVTQGVSFKQYIKEMSQGLPTTTEVSEKHKDEEPLDTETQTTTSCIGVTEKKSHQTRKKAETVRVTEDKRVKAKNRKKLENQIDCITKLKNEIKLHDLKIMKRKLRKDRKKESDRFKTKKLSSQTYQEPDVVVAITEFDLQGSIRKIEPMGNPLLDHYNSYQKRSIIVVRAKKNQKKCKGKMIKKKEVKKDMNKFVKTILSK